MEAVTAFQLRKAVIESLREFLAEMENARDNIATQALDHVQPADVVITLGQSRTVDAFLRVRASCFLSSFFSSCRTLIHLFPLIPVCWPKAEVPGFGCREWPLEKG